MAPRVELGRAHRHFIRGNLRFATPSSSARHEPHANPNTARACGAPNLEDLLHAGTERPHAARGVPALGCGGALLPDGLGAHVRRGPRTRASGHARRRRRLLRGPRDRRLGLRSHDQPQSQAGALVRRAGGADRSLGPRLHGPRNAGQRTRAPVDGAHAVGAPPMAGRPGPPTRRPAPSHRRPHGRDAARHGALRHSARRRRTTRRRVVCGEHARRRRRHGVGCFRVGSGARLPLDARGAWPLRTWRVRCWSFRGCASFPPRKQSRSQRPSRQRERRGSQRLRRSALGR